MEERREEKEEGGGVRGMEKEGNKENVRMEK